MHLHLTMNQIERAARLYCAHIGIDADELILDALTMEKSLPRWRSIRDQMASDQLRMRFMHKVAQEALNGYPNEEVNA